MKKRLNSQTKTKSQMKKKQKQLKWGFWLWFLGGAMVLGVSFIYIYTAIVNLGVGKSALNGQIIDLDAPIEINFGYPVKKSEAEEKLKFFPEGPCHYEWGSELAYGEYGSKLFIYPENLWEAGKKYYFQTEQMVGLAGMTVGPQAALVKTVNLPEIVRVEPDGELDLNEPVKVMTEGLSESFSLAFIFDPEIKFETTEYAEGEFELNFLDNLEQGREYKLKIETLFKGQEVLANHDFKVKVKPPVTIIDQDPVDGRYGFPVYGQVSLTFSRPVNEESFKERFSITPDPIDEETLKLNGEFGFENNKVFFKPGEDFVKGVSYTVKLLPGIQARDDSGHTENGSEYTFYTRYSDNGIPDPYRAPIHQEGKSIEISLGKQTLFAYENGRLVNSFLVSTGIPVFPTPTGSFYVSQKTPVKHYVGNYGPGSPYNFDLPGVKWNLRIGGTSMLIHGAYWHNNFGHVMSHGCVNLAYPNAEWIYNWAPIGTPIEIYY